MQQPIKITCYSLQISAPAILFSFQSIPTLLQRSMVLFVVKGEARMCLHVENFPSNFYEKNVKL